MKVAQLCLTFCDSIECSLPGFSLWNSPGKNIGVGCHFFLQEIFLTQGSNSDLLPCRQIPYHLIHQGSPDYMVFILLFVDVYHTDWFANIEKSLLPWDKSHVIMVGLSCLLASSNRKESAHNAGDWGLIPGSGRSPGEENGNPLQYSCLENPTESGAWWATVHRVAKSKTWLSG